MGLTQTLFSRNTTFCVKYCVTIEAMSLPRGIIGLTQELTQQLCQLFLELRLLLQTLLDFDYKSLDGQDIVNFNIYVNHFQVQYEDDIS